MSSDIEKEIKSLWSALKTLTEALDNFNKKLDQIIAFQSLQGQIQEMVEDKIEQRLKALGLEESKDFTNYSKFIA